MAEPTEHVKALRRAVSGQDAEPVEIETGVQAGHDHGPAPSVPPAAITVDADQVIGRLANQIAELTRDNAVLGVMAEQQQQRIAQLEQAVRDGDEGHR